MRYGVKTPFLFKLVPGTRASLWRGREVRPAKLIKDWRLLAPWPSPESQALWLTQSLPFTVWACPHYSIPQTVLETATKGSIVSGK